MEEGWELPNVPFQLAAVEAVRGDTAKAMTWLRRAYDAGYRRPRTVELDPMFDALRGNPDFEKLMDDMRADVAEMRERILEQEAALEAARAAKAAGGP